MALNFPIPTSVGQVYQDPTSGNTYVCTSLGPPAQWVGSGSSTSLDGTYLRKDASNDPVTGNLLLNPTTNVSPLTLQQPVGNTTPALKIENSGSGNSIEANGFSVSQTGITSLPSGTAASPSITTSGDTNTGIYFPAADTIGLVEGGTEVVRINSSGNVGIGTTSPATGLHVAGSGYLASTISIQRTDSIPGYWQLGTTVAANHFVIRDAAANNQNRFVIDDTGKVGIGTDYPATGLHIVGSNFAESSISLQRTDSIPGHWQLGTTVAANHFVIRDAAANQNRFVINDTGNVGIGDNPSSLARLLVSGTIRYLNRPAAGTITPIGFDVNGDLRASSSSLRYKHDVQDLETGLNEVMQLRPVSFKFNGETRTNMGFIAEEIDELGLSDVMLYNEENQPEGVLYANMVSLLTKAIQEQQVQIEQLKTEINLLKGIEP